MGGDQQRGVQTAAGYRPFARADPAPAVVPGATAVGCVKFCRGRPGDGGGCLVPRSPGHRCPSGEWATIGARPLAPLELAPQDIRPPSTDTLLLDADQQQEQVIAQAEAGAS